MGWDRLDHDCFFFHLFPKLRPVYDLTYDYETYEQRPPAMNRKRTLEKSMEYVAG